MCGNIGKSDHTLIKYMVQADAKNTKQYRNFRRAKTEEMRGLMRKDWSGLMEGMNVNEMWGLKNQSNTQLQSMCQSKKQNGQTSRDGLTLKCTRKLRRSRRHGRGGRQLVAPQIRPYTREQKENVSE